MVLLLGGGICGVCVVDNVGTYGSLFVVDAIVNVGGGFPIVSSTVSTDESAIGTDGVTVGRNQTSSKVSLIYSNR